MGRPPKNGWSKNKKFFNGKPLEYWERETKKVIVHALVRASFSVDNPLAPHMQKAATELMGMAFNVHRVLAAEAIEERDRCRKNLARFIDFLKPDPPKKKRVRKNK